MAKTITQLPDATVVNGSDELIIQQAGVTKRATKTEVLAGIVNANVDAAAAIAGTKIAPNFGSQNVTTTGVVGLGMTPTGLAGLELVNDLSLFKFGGQHNLVARRANGTQGSPTIVADGDGIGRFLCAGYDGSEYRNAGQISIEVDGTPGTNDMPGRLVFSTTADGSASVTERMRLDKNGYLNVASTTIISPSVTTNAGVSIGPVGILASRSANPCFNLQRTTSNGSVAQFFRDTDVVGSISVTTTATAYNTSSDYRLKESPTPLAGGLATVDELKPCEFTWKSDGSIGRGFIAHELQAVVPEAVSGEKDAVDEDGRPQYQGVDAAKVVPYLVSAIKELKARVEALEAAQP